MYETSIDTSTPPRVEQFVGPREIIVFSAPTIQSRFSWKTWPLPEEMNFELDVGKVGLPNSHGIVVDGCVVAWMPNPSQCLTFEADADPC